MKVSVKLAQKYSNVPLNKIGTEALLARIGSQLGAVEEVQELATLYKDVVVVKVHSCEKHPNADKLNVCLIDDGGIVTGVDRNEQGLVQVVCGAPNVRAGLTVAWIPPGAVVPSTALSDPFTLGSRELRGVTSNGMLASPHELAISEDHAGILEIDSPEVEESLMIPGTKFSKLYDLDDVVIDCENKMFTHRPDCFGVMGVARELAGIQGLQFISPDWYMSEPQFDSVNELPLNASVEAKELVPRFMCAALNNVKVAPSPIWMQSALTRAGIKPINNVVDVTNYVMQLTGQPLHAYDYDKVQNNSSGTPTLIARTANEEKIDLLNGKSQTFGATNVVIATDKVAIGLAGVMGGSDTEVDDQTKNIIVEVANFDMYNIRKTAMQYGLFTDAVTRFSKGQSILQNPRVLAYAMRLLNELAGAKQASDVLDIHDEIAPVPSVTVSMDFINIRLGSSMTLEDARKLLRNVEFEINDSEDLTVTPPFWRTDVSIPEDIVEELGRLNGFDKLPVSLPHKSLRPAPVNPVLQFNTRVRQILANGGANEVQTYSFVHGKLLEKVGQDVNEAFSLSNALSPDLQYYRLSVTPSLLSHVNANNRAGYGQFGLFEISKVHSKSNYQSAEKLPKETLSLGFVFAASDKSAKKYSGASFYQSKKYLEWLTESLGVEIHCEAMTAETDAVVSKPFNYRRSAVVHDKRSGKVLGILGEYRSEVQKSMKLPNFCSGFEIDIDLLRECSADRKVYNMLSKFPATQQDISFKVSREVKHAELADLMILELEKAAATHGYIWKLRPLDIYESQDNQADKHISFSLTLQHLGRTLVTKEVNVLLDEIAKAAMKEFEASRL